MKKRIREVIKRHSGAWRQSAGLLLIPLLMVSHKATAISRMDIHGGSLFVGASLSVGELHLDAGATLGGIGTIIGDVIVAGTINPALSTSSPATLTIQGEVEFVSGSSLLCHATTHTQVDKIIVDGLAWGSCAVLPTASSGAIPVKQEVIVANSSIYIFYLFGTDRPNWRLEENSSSDLLLTHTTGNSDGNNLPDWFELEHFLVRTGTPDGDDGDNDNLTNYEERIAGTDPTDGSSTFALDLIYLGDSDFRVEWPSVAGRKYSIYFGENVSTRTTPIIEDLSAQPPTNTHVLSNWSDDLNTTFIHGTVERLYD